MKGWTTHSSAGRSITPNPEPKHRPSSPSSCPGWPWRRRARMPTTPATRARRTTAGAAAARRSVLRRGRGPGALCVFVCFVFGVGRVGRGSTAIYTSPLTSPYIHQHYYTKQRGRRRCRLGRVVLGGGGQGAGAGLAQVPDLQGTSCDGWSCVCVCVGCLHVYGGVAAHPQLNIHPTKNTKLTDGRQDEPRAAGEPGPAERDDQPRGAA